MAVLTHWRSFKDGPIKSLPQLVLYLQKGKLLNLKNTFSSLILLHNNFGNEFSLLLIR